MAIVDAPVEDLDPPDGLDAVTWTWDIEREGQRRQITVAMSRTLLESTGHPSQDAAVARETKGRNYVEAVLDQKTHPATVRPTPTTPSPTTSWTGTSRYRRSPVRPNEDVRVSRIPELRRPSPARPPRRPVFAV